MNHLYTQTWFDNQIPNFQYIKTLLTYNSKILEIGAFEGKATCWMLENLLDKDGSITVIDTFQGGEEHTDLDLSNLRNRFEHNIGISKKETQTVRVIQNTSTQGLSQLINEKELFDFIYVDGSHIAPDVLTDAVLSYNLLQPNGIMLFDDYLWDCVPGITHRPKLAIDAFTSIFSDSIKIVLNNYQLAITKT